MNRILCWSCQHRRAIPGDAHVRCAANTPDDNPLKLLVNFRFLNFDPNYPEPVTKCDAFAATTVDERNGVR